VMLDEKDEVIRPAILWNDTRTTAQTKEITEKVGGEAELLKNVYNRALEGFTLPKILWLKENEPENFAKVCKVVMPKDFIHFMLTGNLYTDVSDAAGTCAFDVKAAKWSEKVIKAVGLDPSIFPEAIESTGKVGKITDPVAKELGLPSGVIVAAGGADNSCAAIGTGVVSPGEAVVSIGTSGTVVAFIDKIDKPVTGDVHLFNYSFPKSYYAMGCMLSAGEAFNWFKRELFPSKSMNDLNALAEKSGAGSGGLIFLPYLSGERSPYNNPNARGVFIGLNATSSCGDMARAVMEGVAFNVKAMFDIVSEFTNINTVYITGGGAKSKLWGQIIADVLGCEISVLNIEEGPPFGAALIAAVAAGTFASFQAAKDACLKVQSTIKPTADTAAYQKIYPVFKAAYEANKGVFDQLKALR